MNYLLIPQTTGSNPLTRAFHGHLTVGACPTASDAQVDIYSMEEALHKEGLAQYPYDRNENRTAKLRRAQQRLERTKLALYHFERYQFGGFDAFKALGFRERKELLGSIEPFDQFVDGTERPFPFRDALRTAEDAANYGRALDRWADALRDGVPKVSSDGRRDAMMPVREDMLLRPEVVAQLAPQGVLMTASETALLQLLQEAPTPLNLQTANELAEVEEQTFAHGEKSATIPQDIQADLPPLRREVSFVQPKGRITELTKQYQAEGHPREEARTLARVHQAQLQADFARTLSLQLMAASGIVERLRQHAEATLTTSVMALGRTDLTYLVDVVMRAGVRSPQQVTVKDDQHPELLALWVDEGTHEAWTTAIGTFQDHLTALTQAQKAHAVKQLEVLPKIFIRYQTGIVTEEVTTLDGAKLLLEQEGTSDPVTQELLRWVTQQEQLVDRRVAYGRDPFVPDFIEVATNTYQARTTDIAPNVQEFLTEAEPYTLVIGSHISEVPGKQRMQIIRKLRKFAPREGTLVAQDDLLVNASTTFTTVMELPQDFRTYVRPAQHDLGRVNPLSVAELIAQATEVHVMLATPADHEVYFAGQRFNVDRRHAALFTEAASLRRPDHNPSVYVTQL